MPGAVDQAEEEEEEEATTGSEEVHSAECCTEDLAAEGEVGRSPASWEYPLHGTEYGYSWTGTMNRSWGSQEVEVDAEEVHRYSAEHSPAWRQVLLAQPPFQIRMTSRYLGVPTSAPLNPCKTGALS